MTDNRQTLSASVTDPLIDFLNRVYAQEMEEPGAYTPFQLVEDDHRADFNAIEKGLMVLMTDYKSVLFEVRDDRSLLNQPETDAESASEFRALRVPDDWEPSGEIRVAEIRTDE